MSTFCCQIHMVEFSSEPTKETKEKDLEFARLPRCPVCAWTEHRAQIDRIRTLESQRDCLLLAIELKQQHLVTKK